MYNQRPRSFSESPTAQIAAPDKDKELRASQEIQSSSDKVGDEDMNYYRERLKSMCERRRGKQWQLRGKLKAAKYVRGKESRSVTLFGIDGCGKYSIFKRLHRAGKRSAPINTLGTIHMLYGQSSI